MVIFTLIIHKNKERDSLENLNLTQLRKNLLSYNTSSTLFPK